MRRYIIATPHPDHGELLCALRGTGLVEDVVHSQADLDRIRGRTIVMLSWLHILQESFLREQQEVLNVHNSLLPRYRGRHAFTWAMIQGEREVGYTMHTADTRVDSGPIYSQIRIPILPEDDINTLFQRAHQVLQDWLPAQLSLHSRGLLVPIPQAEELASYFRARKPDDGRINWDQSFESIRNFLRAQRPPYTPGAFVEHKGQRLHTDHCVATEPLKSGADPGQVLSVEPTERRVTIACRDFKLEVYFVQDARADTLQVLKVGERLC
jgi:methionyl-tRNA formyltransferase